MNPVKFSNEELDLFKKKLNEFLSDRGWRKKEIGNQLTYIKSEKYDHSNNFLDKPKKRNLPPLDAIMEEMIRFFLRKGYVQKVEENIAINDVKDTFLIGAGIQYFRRCFWGSEAIPEGRFFIPQPVIRIKYIDKVNEGITTSFVNPTSAQIGASFSNHLHSLDDSFDFLSQIGLYMGDFNLAVVPQERYCLGKKGNWSKTDGFSLRLNYLNLGIGDAGYIRIPTKNNGIVEISDIGLGLERILWGLYKTPSYFDLISPRIGKKDQKNSLIDSVRTATLLAMSNINEARPDAFNQFRKFTKIASNEYGSFDMFKLVGNYFNFWSKFIHPKRSFLDTYYFLDNEISKEIKDG